ncbi:hypothetical protein CUJ91_19160 [Paraburkholderia graminis]|jgi:hypothetical protein|uniref:hypothetical protein n=1 Tax=Paraburkholderia graminis TaxID=60548 RepID=UPI000DEF3D85|nr:hypothetical protein [Paraburkholderia graminis]AXF10127.1 hypothetical protein CUJ91_19160 [Paraburkholderia graminis]MDR6470730.1 hypothetical protein [Paraburkholderia graminis]
MKRVVVSALLATCLAQAATQAAAQTVSNQCFAIGDIAGQVASWRAHKKTKAQALDQAAKYYRDDADRQTFAAIIEKIYAPNAPRMTPDQASMAFTSDCVKARNEQTSAR